MERINHLLEGISKGHGILAILSFVFLGILSIAKRERKGNTPDFLGDNAPYTLIDNLKDV